MIVLHSIDPVAISIGGLEVRWYGLMYLVAFGLAWSLALYRTKKYHLSYSKDEISDLIFYGAMGVILGGRIGYMLFYNWTGFWANPLSLFKTWEGGMSFHGGLIGVILSLWLYSRHFKKPFWSVTDFVAPLVPLGLAFGRIGNFINGELWGRVTTVPWGMVFPQSDGQIRHPSQLYESLGEGLILFILIGWYASKPRQTGKISAFFLMGYAILRFIIEFFRQPDLHLGFVALGWLTMGQLLCVPMFMIGLVLWFMKPSSK